MKRINFNTRSASGNNLPQIGYDITKTINISPLRFGIHKEGNAINSSKRWVITELSTGLAVLKGKWDGTRSETIQQAITLLKKVGMIKTKKVIAETVAKYGVAN